MNECKFIPTYLPPVKRIIVMGDIHGDLSLTIKLFRLAKLINNNLDWIGNDTVVVQVGDQIDSCRPLPGNSCHKQMNNDKQEDILVLEFFDDMHNKAKKYNGAVYSLIGNHEVLNIMGMFDYVSYENYNNFNYGKFKGIEGRKKLFERNGMMARKFACNRKAILIIGSNLFVHAGITLDIAKEYSPDKINEIIRLWLLNKINNDKLLLDQDISPFWTRLYGTNENNCKDLNEIMKLYHFKNMIIGHTPQILFGKNINITCNNIYRVDNGLSRAFDILGKRKMQVLEILNDNEFKIIED